MKIKYILLTIITIIFPLTIYAQDIDYDITNYYIKANILENGDMEVNELIVMDGTFNGYEREIAYKNSKLNSFNNEKINFEHDNIYNANGISDYECYAKYVKNVSFDTFNENFTKLRKVNSTYGASKGDVYMSSKSDAKIFRMYYGADDEKVAFLIKYKVDKVVVMHNDVAELYWTFMGEDFTDDIKDLKIKVYLPGEDISNNFRVWAHGDLTGEIHNIDNKYIEAKIDKLYANNPVDIRTTFDKNLIIDNTQIRHSNVDALDDIINIETNRANEANQKREKAKKLYLSTLIISIGVFIWQILSIFYIYKKYDREYKSDFVNDYNREFIDDYDVEVVDYIMNKNITPNAMSASIMNLIYKNNIKVEKMKSEKKDEYIFTLLNENNLSKTEHILINFLFYKIGNKESFTTKELKSYAKSTKTYNSFNNSYTSWKNMVIKNGKDLKIFESHGKVIAYSIIMLIITRIINFIAISLTATNIFVFINDILAFGILIYTIVFKKRSIYGNEQYVRWKAFKKFLNDFGDFKTKELPEIELWERYMVYATVFGLADKVAKTMNVKIKELEASGVSVYSYDSYFYHCHLARSINSSVSTAVANAHATAASVASSSSSSGSGFGGGFSSGGGFGGGGGGGHGF